jgi:tripartite-type tricarboxylate transporter receptor subunit TctC
MTESGGPDFEASFWVGLFAPAGTPRAAIAKLNATLKDTLQGPEIQDYMKKQTYVAAWMTPEDLQKLVTREVDQWTRVVRDVGVPLQ